MTRNNSNGGTTPVGGESLTTLEWMRERIRAGHGRVPPSTERVLSFIETLLRCPGAVIFQRLAIKALFQTITQAAGYSRSVVVTLGGRKHGATQIECVCPDRGSSAYYHSQNAVTTSEIDEVLASVVQLAEYPSHMIFVTTERIDPEVQEYAAGVYQRTGGIEIAILDCIGFVRHFLHLFHRHRAAFLDTYQSLVLSEPDSAVSFALKRAFLALRAAALPAAESES